jgi:SAM-dependent methyltransferase
MAIRQPLYNLYWKFKNLIIPDLKDSQYFYEKLLNKYATPSTICLDIGCGHRILPEWRCKIEKEFVDKCRGVVGIDYDYPALKMHRSITLKVNGDIGRLPFKSCIFDFVMANMVVEHLEDPTEQFSEIYRVLKPGGHFIFHTPNAYAYDTRVAKLLPNNLKCKVAEWLHGRKESDLYPTYYRANSLIDITLASNGANFKISDIRYLLTSAQFAILVPIAVIELLLIRILMKPKYKYQRPNILVSLKKNITS